MTDTRDVRALAERVLDVGPDNCDVDDVYVVLAEAFLAADTLVAAWKEQAIHWETVAHETQRRLADFEAAALAERDAV